MIKQKTKINPKEILKGRKGITLIALVITIIVLLILAGVSIAMLTGDNGILNKATEAKEKTQKADVIERAKTDLLEYQIEDNGNINKKDLKNVLDKYFEEVPTEEKLPDDLSELKLKSKSEYGGQEIEIADIFAGGLTEKTEETPEIPATPATQKEVNAKIGQTVEYEISDQASEELKQAIGGWRVFYASDEEMFLISSNTIASKTVFGADNEGIPLTSKEKENYTGATDVFATDYGATYNGMWKKKCDENTAYDECERSIATAYLCDKDNWKEYVGNNAPSGTYAVGGPTKELLALSWDQAVENGGENAPEAKVEWKDGDVVLGGYLYDKPDTLRQNEPISKTILPDNYNRGLYNTGISYWLASPDAIDTRNLCAVGGLGHVGRGYYYITSNAVRPLVSIPMSNVKIKDGKIMIGNN